MNKNYDFEEEAVRSFKERFTDLVDDKIASSETKYTKEVMAEQIGISRQTLHSYYIKEDGEINKQLKKRKDTDQLPSSDNLLKLCKFFNVSADYLLGLTKAKSPKILIKTVCNHTGLSEGAVQQFIQLNKKSKENIGNYKNGEIIPENKSENVEQIYNLCLLEIASRFIESGAFVELIELFLDHTVDKLSYYNLLNLSDLNLEHQIKSNEEFLKWKYSLGTQTIIDKIYVKTEDELKNNFTDCLKILIIDRALSSKNFAETLKRQIETLEENEGAVRAKYIHEKLQQGQYAFTDEKKEKQKV